MMPEMEAAGLLGVAEWRLRDLAGMGELRLVRLEAPGGEQVMYFAGEVLALRERLGGKLGSHSAEDEGAGEWPDLIEE